MSPDCDGARPSVELDEPVVRALQARVDEEQRASRLPSLCVGLRRGDSTMWLGAGSPRCDGAPPTAASQYRIGSITKTFLAVLVMQLVEHGRLSLADPLDQHLPGTAIGRVSIAQLLSHTSGLAAETTGPWWERTTGGAFAELTGSLRLVFEPGERFHYSNLGFAVLGEVVARLHGSTWQEVLTTQLLGPLGLRDTTLSPREPAAAGLAVHPHADLLQPEPAHDAGAMGAAGQLWSTPGDLLRWVDVLLRGAPGVLAADTAARMRRPLAIHDEPGAGWSGAHGLGVEVTNRDGRRYVGHGGSMPGFLAGLVADVQSRDAAVALTNSTSGAWMGGLAFDLLDLLAEHAPAPRQTWAPDPGHSDVLELLGQWFWGPAAYVVRARGELLEPCTEGRGRPDRFERDGQDWRGLDGYFAGETLTLVPADPETGTAAHLDVASFRFTRQPYQPGADVPGGVVDWY